MGKSNFCPMAEEGQASRPVLGCIRLAVDRWVDCGRLRETNEKHWKIAGIQRKTTDRGWNAAGGHWTIIGRLRNIDGWLCRTTMGICTFLFLQDLDARKVYCYNLSSCAWSTLNTSPDDCLSSDFVRYSIANLNDSCYHFGGYGSFGDTDDGRHRTEIWKFHFPTLSWTKLSFELPLSKLIFFSHFTNRGQMILCFENGLYQLNATSKPRPLQNICWELISYYPRIRPLISYTDGELKQFGVSNSFIKKLRWWKCQCVYFVNKYFYATFTDVI